MKTEKKTTGQKLKKTKTQCLYEHASGHYYAIKKHRGKIITHVLRNEADAPITDYRLAQKKLWEWIESLDAPKIEKSEALTFAELCDKFLNLKEAKYKKPDTKTPDAEKEKIHNTLKKVHFHFRVLRKIAPHLLTKKITEIKHSDLAQILAPIQPVSSSQDENKWKPRSYNAFRAMLAQVFELAVNDGDIDKNPVAKTGIAKIKDKPDEVPTIEQCEKIVEHIRTRPFSDTAEVSGDLCEFLHCAALGEAEAIALEWKQFDFENSVIKNVKRKKTGEYFDVPMYPHLKPFIIELYERKGRPGKNEKVFEVKSIKQALYNACKRLDYPLYSPRDLRKARIVWLVRKGIPFEVLAQWQGHGDNGVLLRRTYAWVIDDGYKQFEREQLAKLGGIPHYKEPILLDLSKAV